MIKAPTKVESLPQLVYTISCIATKKAAGGTEVTQRAETFTQKKEKKKTFEKKKMNEVQRPLISLLATE